MKKRPVAKDSIAVNKGCVVVADGSRARIFSVNPNQGKLKSLHVLINPEQKLPKRELARRKPGSKMAPNSGGLFGFHGHIESHEMFDEVTRRFARQIVERLKSMKNDHDFQSMIIASSPKFLGYLRGEMDKETKKSVTRWLNKDLSVLSPTEISEHLGLRDRKNPDHFLFRSRTLRKPSP